MTNCKHKDKKKYNENGRIEGNTFVAQNQVQIRFWSIQIFLFEFTPTNDFNRNLNELNETGTT